MQTKLFSLLALVACCTAASIGPRSVALDEGSFLLTTPDGKTITVVKNVGNLGQNYLDITVNGPNWPAKTVRIYDELGVPDIYDDLLEVFAEYKVIPNEVVFSKLVHTIERQVATGAVEPKVLEVLKYIISPVEAAYTASAGFFNYPYSLYGSGIYGKGLFGGYPWGIYSKSSLYGAGLYGKGFYGPYSPSYYGSYYPYYYGAQSYYPGSYYGSSSSYYSGVPSYYGGYSSPYYGGLSSYLYGQTGYGYYPSYYSGLPYSYGSILGKQGYYGLGSGVYGGYPYASIAGY